MKTERSDISQNQENMYVKTLTVQYQNQKE